MKSTTTIKKEENSKLKRPPIVVVVGHIDHGKTTLLDSLRKTKVAEKESGGITQHIGAYQVDHNGKKITFIDTPGHETFSKMRSRGTAVADIGILVVAADEGVKPQTKEAITILNNAGIPFLVAINKIDKSGADVNRVKKELAEHNVLVEDWGGKIPAIEISAKQNLHLNDLLELILLIAEVEELEANEDPATGVIIESHKEQGRGNTATLLLTNGKLQKSDTLAIGKSTESIKIFEDFQGNPIEKAEYSMPIRISSLATLPEVGERFLTFSNKKDAEQYIQSQEKEGEKTTENESVPETDKPTLFIVLKTDVSGSKEAIEESLQKLQYPEVGNIVLKSEVGDLNEADLRTASVAKNSAIVAFKVKIPRGIKDLADRMQIKILHSEIIYDLINEIKKELAGLMQPEITRVDLGRAKILALFKKLEGRQVVGGKVTSGKIAKGSMCQIERKGVLIGIGKIRELQHLKQQTDEVKEGLEFGAMVEIAEGLQENDVMFVYVEEKKYRTL